MRRGVFPGSFNPATIAHLAIAEAACEQCRLDSVDFVISTVTLGKEGDPHLAPLADRTAALERLGATRPWLGVRVTEQRLLVDIAEGYDVLVLGADKWAQVIDASWYGTETARDAALARLPEVALAPRAHLDITPAAVGVRMTVLDVHPEHHHVSASAVRAGRAEWHAERPTAGSSAAARSTAGGAMSDTPEQTEALGRARVHREALADAADRLDHAITKPSGDLDAWRSAVQAALAEVGTALDRHVGEVEGPEGLFAEVVARSPRLAHEVAKLEEQHVGLAEQYEALVVLVPRAATPADVDAVREASLALLQTISRHRHLGADLIYESYTFDIGGEGD